MSRPRESAGFTIIELMVVVVVVAIFAAVALPNFSTAIRNSRLQASSNELASLIQYARSTAVQNNQSMALCVSEGVWSVHKACSDSNPLRSFEPPTGVTVQSSVNSLTFNSNGTATGAADLISCHGDDHATGIKVKVEASGLVRINSPGKDGTSALSSCTPS